MNGSYTMLIAPGTQDPNNSNQGAPIFPIAMQELGNGNLLIADSNPGGDPADHHQILEYNAAMDLIASIDLTQPTDASGDPPQPISLLLTPDGSLMVGVSPNEYYPDGAVEEIDLANPQPTAPIISSIGAPAGLALVPTNVMTVPAAAWTSAGLTLAVADGELHVYQTGTANDAVFPFQTDDVGKVQISGPENATSNLTIDFGGGNPIPAGGISFDTGSISAPSTITITGSPDLNGTIQAMGSVTFGQGNLANETVSSSLLVIQSGTITANLTGPGGLSKTSSGTLTLAGSNSYQGGTSVAAGKLVVTASTALPTGTSLTVGAGGSSVFDPSTALQTTVALSSNSAVLRIAPAATEAAFSPPSTARADAAVVTPLQGPALVSGFTTSLASASTAAVLVHVTVPMALIAISPSNLVSNSIWRNYTQAIGPSIVQASRAAGDLAWLSFSDLSSNAEESTTGNDRRVSALDAVLTLYGKP